MADAAWCRHFEDSTVCEYVQGRTPCRKPRTHYYVSHGLRHPLCLEHAKPWYHPHDLRDTIREEHADGQLSLTGLAPEPRPEPPGVAYARGMKGSALAARKWSDEEVAAIDRAIVRASIELDAFTADDVWSRAPDVPVTKGLAGRLNAARNRGDIEATGEVVFAKRGGQHDHRQRLAVWRRPQANP